MEIVFVEDQKKPFERPVLASGTAVTLLGAGLFRETDLRDALEVAPLLVAVDGGADSALSAGRTPVAVIGDLDSISPDARRRLPPETLHHIAEQESTDFDKALRNLDVPLTLAVGFTGARLDHELAALHTLVTRPEHRCIVIGDTDIVFLAPTSITLDLAPDTRVSLFPMRQVSGRSDGLRWPIDGLVFHPAERIGTSNVVTKRPMELETDRPGLLVILPRSELPAAVQALDPRSARDGEACG